MSALFAQDLGPYPAPSRGCGIVLSSVDGGQSSGGPAGGGRAPADPASQEELYVDNSGCSAIWRMLGGQMTHTSFRSTVLGPGAQGFHADNEQGRISQVVRCRFPVILKGWSSKSEADSVEGVGSQKKKQLSNGRGHQQQSRRGQSHGCRVPSSVCILRTPDLVTVHYPNGDTYDVTLPCEAQSLQPLHEGLLIQRFSSDADDGQPVDGVELDFGRGASRPMDLETGIPREGVHDCLADEAVPSLFTLLHPLDELRPVALLSPSPGAIDIDVDGERESVDRSFQYIEDNQRLVCDACERVIFAGGGGSDGTGPNSSLLLTYHSVSRRHSLWHVLPLQESEHQRGLRPEQERKSAGQMLAAEEMSCLGPLGDQTPANNSWRATSTGLSSTPAAEGSSLSSTLLGVSALDSSSSAAGLSIIDNVLAGGRARRDRMSVGNSSRLGPSTFGNGRGRVSAGGGGGRRASSGSNASWVGGASTRNEALASALGLGQSGLGVTSSVLGLGQQAGGGGGPGVSIGAGGGGARRLGSDMFVPPILGRAVGGSSAGTGKVPFDERPLFDEQEVEEDETEAGEAQPIRPHLGLSLLWRESGKSRAPAEHVFCAAAVTPEGTPQVDSDANASNTAASIGRRFLLCMVQGQVGKLRTLSVSIGKGSGPDKGLSMAEESTPSVSIAEAFTLPCRSAVGLSATGGSEGGISPDILVLTPERRLHLHRGGGAAITGVSLAASDPAVDGYGWRQENDEPESLSEAVDSCFTVTMRSGARRRLRLSLDPPSPVVAACLRTWDALLSPHLASSLRADVVCVRQSLARKDTAGKKGPLETPKTSRVVPQHDDGGGAGDSGEWGTSPDVVHADLSWTALVFVIRELVLGETSLPARAKKASQDSKGRTQESKRRDDEVASGGGAWDAMLSSPFHQQFIRENAILLAGLRVSGPDSRPSSQKRTSLRSSRPLRLELRTRREAFLYESTAVFDALHLTLEEMKTSRLTLSLVPRLASLLLSLTRVCGKAGEAMRDFADHYWRDAIGCGAKGGEVASMVTPGDDDDNLEGVSSPRTVLLPSRPTRFDRVPCIRGWVHARVRTGCIVTTGKSPAASASSGKQKTAGARPAKAAVADSMVYNGEEGPFPTLPKSRGALETTRRLCRFYHVLCRGGESGGSDEDAKGTAPPVDGADAAAAAAVHTRASVVVSRDWVGSRLVEAMVEEDFTVDDLDRTPLGLTLPLLEVLHAARSQAPADWPTAAHKLVDRDDLNALRQMLEEIRRVPRTIDSGIEDQAQGGDSSDEKCGAKGQQSREDEPEEVVQNREQSDEEEAFGSVGGYWGGGRISSSGTGRRDLLHESSAGREARGGAAGEVTDLDGLAWVDEMSSLRFGRDRRVREACRLLRGSRPIRFHVERSPESSDHDHQQKQQARLLQLAMRTLAGPAGRGMLTLGTLAPLLAEPLPIPPLCLAGRLRKPADVVVNLDVAAGGITADTTLWAEFHNGVAAGLRLRHEWGSNDSPGEKRRFAGGRSEAGFDGGGVSRTWITYNRPAGGANNAHGGFLMALGLQGHLSSLAMTDVYEYLTLGQESTTVGVLLGMAAARRGSAELSTHKMLCLHVPSLLPHPFAEMETSSVTQAAALAGVGLLYQGTSHRLMTEFLLGEMGRSPCSDRFADREGYALACGLSLGMINLGKGASGEMAGVADLKLEQQLYRYMSGGKDPSAPSGVGGGPGDGAAANGRSGAQGAGARSRSSGPGGVLGSESFGPSRISPGEYVNTDVTAPAALVALALVHLRSGDKALAEKLALPQTHFQLDYTRPEQLLLRVVVRGLVLWDEVSPTEEWVDAQIPEVVSVEYSRLHEPLPEELAAVVDRQSVRQAHANIVAGACLCLGLHFAGTADKRARATVLSRVMHFKRLRESTAGAGSGAAIGTTAGASAGARDPHLASRRPERPVLEMCLSTAVTALGMIMAGTGDLESLRIMRELRTRVEGEVTYGTHMAISMGIGLLFLGGGMASLGRENEHIAALMAGFFPRKRTPRQRKKGIELPILWVWMSCNVGMLILEGYPASPDDNQYHLQALRHLYVLAVQRRGVDAVDVDTGESLFVPVSVELVRKEDPARETPQQGGDEEPPGAPESPPSAVEAKDTADESAGGSIPEKGIHDTELGSDGVISLVTPCILPDLREVSRVSIRSPRYFPIELDLTRNPEVAHALRRYCRIYVKRRVGHLSYKNDPHALRSLLFQTFPRPMSSSSGSVHPDSYYEHNQHHHHHSRSTGHDRSVIGDSGVAGNDPVQSKADFLSTFTEDPHLLNFARHFCDAGSGGGGGNSGGGGALGLPSGRRLMLGTEALGDASALARYFGGALLECLAGEKEEGLGLHLSLCHASVTARHTLDASVMWDLRLVLTYGRRSALQLALAEAASSVARGSNIPANDGTKRKSDVRKKDRGGDGPAGEGAATRGRARSGESIRGDGRAVVDGDVGAEAPVASTLLHPDLLASLEVHLTRFFSSLGFDVPVHGTTRQSQAVNAGTQKKSLLWQYISSGGGGKDIAGVDREYRLFGAFLVFFGIPAPVALEEALGEGAVSLRGISLVDVPALVRRLPGISPSALLRMAATSSG